MTTITLNFDIERLSSYYEDDTGYYDVETVEGAIVNMAAHTLTKQLSATLEKTISEKVEAEVCLLVSEKVGEIIEGTLNGLLQRTNEWGEAKGEPLTLREMIVNEKDGWLNEQVDRDGNPTTRRYNSNDTRLTWLTKTYVRDQFGADIKQEMDAVVAELKATMREEARDIMAKALGKIADVDL